MRLGVLSALLPLCAMAADLGAGREVFYPWPSTGGSIVPRFDKGYLVAYERNNNIQVYGPSGQLLYRQHISWPATTSSSSGQVAIRNDGIAAVSVGYLTRDGYAAGIQLLDTKGEVQLRIPTGRYVPLHLAFDQNGDLWTIGWQRDKDRNEHRDSQDYNLVRRFSKAGKETGSFLPRSLWEVPGSHVGGGLGHWRMTAAKDRIGAIFDAGDRDEWLEWDLEGRLLYRTKLPPNAGGRAYSADGRLIVQFPAADKRSTYFAYLDRSTGAWTPITYDPPVECGLLMGADGNNLVCRPRWESMNRLVWLTPSDLPPVR